MQGLKLNYTGKFPFFMDMETHFLLKMIASSAVVAVFVDLCIVSFMMIVLGNSRDKNCWLCYHCLLFLFLNPVSVFYPWF